MLSNTGIAARQLALWIAIAVSAGCGRTSPFEAKQKGIDGGYLQPDLGRPGPDRGIADLGADAVVDMWSDVDGNRLSDAEPYDDAFASDVGGGPDAGNLFDIGTTPDSGPQPDATNGSDSGNTPDLATEPDFRFPSDFGHTSDIGTSDLRITADVGTQPDFRTVPDVGAQRDIGSEPDLGSRRDTGFTPDFEITADAGQLRDTRPPTDTGGQDAWIPRDSGFTPDEGICTPTCEQICWTQLWDQCTLPARERCLDICQNADAAATQCLRKIRCDGVINCESAQVCMRDPDPDLVVQLKAEPGPQQAIVGSASVCNRGLGSSNSNARLEIRLLNTAAPSELRLILDVWVEPLLPGQCTSYDVASEGLQPGTYRVQAAIDTTNRVQEADEQNNLSELIQVIVADTSPKLPDLRLVGFSATAAQDRVYYTLRACNESAVDVTESTTVGLYFNRPAAPAVADQPDRSIGLGPLAAGHCAALTMVTSLAAGTYVSWAYVDQTARIAETSEQNNVAGPREVSVRGGNPDLAVVSLQTHTVGQDRVRYRVSICNQGSAPAQGNLLALYYNRATAPSAGLRPDQQSEVSALEAQACTTISFEATLAPGSYHSWVFIDYLDRLSEQDETNNLAHEMFELTRPRGPDLQLTSFAATATDTGYVSYVFTACNRGQSASQAAAAGVYFHRDQAPPAADTPDAAVDIPVLAPGQCSQRSFVTRLDPGTYLSWAIVDPFDEVDETDENNNLLGPQEVSVAGTERCDTICDALYAPCGMLTEEEVTGCATICERQTSKTIDCAYRAAQLQRCLAIVTCFFSF